MAQELLTADEMAARLRIQPETLRGWARRGFVPRIVASPKVIRFEPAAVIDALKSHRLNETEVGR